MPLIDAVGTLENRPSLVARLAVAGWLMVSCLAPAAARGEDSFSFGVVPQFEARHLAAIWQPILEELGARTGYRFDLVGSPRIPAFEASFLAGEFDFAYMNPYHAMLAAEGQGYVPLVRDGAGRLRGILVVRDDSPYRDVADLEGRRIAFPSPNALGASLLMRADLASLYGLAFEPVFVQTHSSVYLNVALGQMAAGGGISKTLDQQPPAVRDALRTLYETREMAPHPVTAHPRVPAAVREAVRGALLALGRTEAGAALLAQIPIQEIATATAGDYAELGEWGLETLYATPQ